MAAECFGFREKGPELRSTLTGAKGDVRAERQMISALRWMLHLSLFFDAPVFLLSLKASAPTSRNANDTLTKLFINLERRESVYKCITPS